MPDSTRILRDDTHGIKAAAGLLGAGQLVAFATETVYGLGADARDGAAVAAVYAAKGRPSFNPLIVHLADAAQAAAYADMSADAQKLADAFWPGPLTLVVPLRAGHGLSSLVTAGLETVALRVPAHARARALLRAFGGPVAAPSANPSGRISPTTAAHVIAGLDGRIAAVQDAGACAVGVESTIIGWEDGRAVLLRAGGVAAEELAAILGCSPGAPAHGGITAPGQLRSHYAPGAAVRLNARTAREGEVMLGFGEIAGDMSLSETGDLAQAAARLFDALHALDATGKPIAVAPVPERGLGVAINDRLRRAAAPR
ncbi:threonylcarbamoyl-AMP synthase [Sulfitobacter albidus]|uniref:Threonylcarbamoyl-AMP synthase n=1 Tax=Sulfitobacter albidus TaxID=2829501 RepID=A0A975PLD1_9RHOB|nr:L-threonylcarbamoyladenylate synthase [Sulfitobacter albidus]QUJ75588.1 threonylcarbamoyl-AMP synthase [Sulfitobacter albidus]